jgi:NHS family xanthosine MFS transporter
MKLVKTRLIIMNFLIFSVWGAYLCSLGNYLGRIKMGKDIGQFFAIQGIVSLFMPAIIGIIADRWIPAQILLSICHLISAIFNILAGYMGQKYGDNVTFGQIFPFYALAVAFFMPTISLGNSVSYNALTKAGLDTVKSFPPIRVFGTVGFIISMWIVNFTGYKNTYHQLYVSAAWGIVLFFYGFTLPPCKTTRGKEKESMIDSLGLRAFTLFKQKNMCIFFIFSFLLGMCLQITNGFCATYLDQFSQSPEYADAFAVKNNVFLSSLSQVSETLCILLIPFFLKRFGIKIVMIIAFAAWAIRFFLLGVGNPTGFGLVLFILSMIVYGVAFDFYNISGSLYVEENTDEDIRSSAQGVFMLMTNGFGATVGSYLAQMVINIFTEGKESNFNELIHGWRISWYIFAAFPFVVGILFAFLFKDSKKPKEQNKAADDV